jgi:hypothetical protein
MKTNEEKILKYFSGLMNEIERTDFEKELSLSKELHDEFMYLKSQIDFLKLDHEIPLDERYFANMLPLMRKHMEKRDTAYYLKRIYYVAPTLAAVMVLLMFILKPSAVPENQYNTLANEVVNNISDREVSQKYLYEIEGDPASIELTFREVNLNSELTADADVNNDELTSLIEKNYSEDYSTLSKLSDKELEVIANNLNLIKIK